MLMEAAIKNETKKVIIVSSNSPCGCNRDKDSLFDENSNYNPYMNYGKSKMLMEKKVNEFYKKNLF